MRTLAMTIGLALAACSSKAAEPVPVAGSGSAAPALTCKDAIENSALDPAAANVVMGIKQCNLEKWSQPLLQCINDAPPGSDLETACFSKLRKR